MNMRVRSEETKEWRAELAGKMNSVRSYMYQLSMLQGVGIGRTRGELDYLDYLEMYQRAKGAHIRLENAFALSGVTGKIPIAGSTDDNLLYLAEARLAGALAYEIARIGAERLPSDKAKKMRVSGKGVFNIQKELKKKK